MKQPRKESASNMSPQKSVSGPFGSAVDPNRWRWVIQPENHLQHFKKDWTLNPYFQNSGDIYIYHLAMTNIAMENPHFIAR